MGLDLGVLNNAIGGNGNGGVVGTLANYSLGKKQLALQAQQLENATDYNNRSLTLNDALERERIGSLERTAFGNQKTTRDIAELEGQTQIKKAMIEGQASVDQAHAMIAASLQRAKTEDTTAKSKIAMAEDEYTRGVAEKELNKANAKLDAAAAPHMQALTNYLADPTPENEQLFMASAPALANTRQARAALALSGDNRRPAAGEGSVAIPHFERDENGNAVVSAYFNTADNKIQPFTANGKKGGTYDNGDTPLMDRVPIRQAAIRLRQLNQELVPKKEWDQIQLQLALETPEQERTNAQKILLANNNSSPLVEHDLGLNTLRNKGKVATETNAMRNAQYAGIRDAERHERATIEHAAERPGLATLARARQNADTWGAVAHTRDEQANIRKSESLINRAPSEDLAAIAGSGAREQQAYTDQQVAKNAGTRATAQAANIEDEVRRDAELGRLKSDREIAEAQQAIKRLGTDFDISDKQNQSMLLTATQQLNAQNAQFLKDHAINRYKLAEHTFGSPGIFERLTNSTFLKGSMPSSAEDAEAYAMAKVVELQQAGQLPADLNGVTPEELVKVTQAIDKGFREAQQQFENKDRVIPWYMNPHEMFDKRSRGGQPSLNNATGR